MAYSTGAEAQFDPETAAAVDAISRRDGCCPVLNSAVVLVAPGRGYNCYTIIDGIKGKAGFSAIRAQTA